MMEQIIRISKEDEDDPVIDCPFLNGEDSCNLDEEIDCPDGYDDDETGLYQWRIPKGCPLRFKTVNVGLIETKTEPYPETETEEEPEPKEEEKKETDLKSKSIVIYTWRQYCEYGGEVADNYDVDEDNSDDFDRWEFTTTDDVVAWCESGIRTEVEDKEDSPNSFFRLRRYKNIREEILQRVLSKEIEEGEILRTRRMISEAQLITVECWQGVVTRVCASANLPYGIQIVLIDYDNLRDVEDNAAADKEIGLMMDNFIKMQNLVVKHVR